jgi:diguanylate cyclase (GGDEF)-like protein
VDMRTYLRVITKGWWLILSAFLISVATGSIFTYSQIPIYRSTATFVVSPSTSLGQFNDFMRSLDSLNSRDGIMMTYAEIANSHAIFSSVYTELQLTPAQRENLYVSSEIIPSTNIVKVIAESDNPLLAKQVADLVGQKTTEYIESLYEAYDMKPLDPANTPVSPSKPRIVENLLLAAILGLAIGVGSAFVLDNLRSSADRIAAVNIVDGDTGIHNRYYFVQRLGEELSRAKRNHHPLSLALINVDHLDAINDMRLPRLRNELLRRVGLFMKRYLREEDLVARFEGDKFALLLPETPGSEAKKILEYLQTRLEWNIFELEEKGVKLNLASSSGIAAYNFNGITREELLTHAEQALQRAEYDSSYDKVYVFEDQEQGTLD